MPKTIIQTNKIFDDWLDSRPKNVKDLAHEFPFGTLWKVDGEDMVVIGWDESDNVLLSKLYLHSDGTPDIDRMFSEDERIRVCAECLRLEHII